MPHRRRSLAEHPRKVRPTFGKVMRMSKVNTVENASPAGFGRTYRTTRPPTKQSQTIARLAPSARRREKARHFVFHTLNRKLPAISLENRSNSGSLFQWQFESAGAVAKWQGGGLQNLYTSVRIRSAPPICDWAVFFLNSVLVTFRAPVVKARSLSKRGQRRKAWKS
jgi:hypothetical protein